MIGKQGQMVFMGFMVMFAIIVLALGTAPMVKEIVDDSRNATNMDCANESITNSVKVACVVTDMSMFYFITGLIALGIAVFISRRFK